ncbi:hypothetical protein F4801DRAFT_575588 [Xylaria longipes]|nr:hypothetical protein F4801DRAFT_575588 [Xylaria longipes]
MDDRYFVYADGPSADGEVVVHIYRSWTGVPLADITIKIPCGEDGKPDPEGNGAKIMRITYEASQERWNYEMIGLANLDTAKGLLCMKGLESTPELPRLRAMLPDLKGARVLNLGCRLGWFSRFACAARVCAIDLSADMPDKARSMTSDDAIGYEEADLEDLTIPEAE